MLPLLVFALATAFALLEAQRQAYDSRAQWRRELRITLLLGGAAALIEAAAPARPVSASWSAGLSLTLAVILLDDFLYYLSHRLAHRVGLFWASHAVHHSPLRYDLLTGLRQPPTWILTPAAAAPIVLLAIGAPPALVALSALLRATHHFLIHTERIRRLPGWLEFVFNTPSHHRVHHSSERSLLDRNFGGILIVWDRLFGTFAAEPSAGVSRYGLAEHSSAPSAWNTFAAPWRTLALRIWAAQSFKQRVGAALGPPTRA